MQIILNIEKSTLSTVKFNLTVAILINTIFQFFFKVKDVHRFASDRYKNRLVFNGNEVGCFLTRIFLIVKNYNFRLTTNRFQYRSLVNLSVHLLPKKKTENSYLLKSLQLN